MWVSSQLEMGQRQKKNTVFNASSIQFTWLSWEKEQHKNIERYIRITLKICSNIFARPRLSEGTCEEKHLLTASLNSPVEEEVSISRQKDSCILKPQQCQQHKPGNKNFSFLLKINSEGQKQRRANAGVTIYTDNLSTFLTNRKCRLKKIIRIIVSMDKRTFVGVNRSAINAHAQQWI